MGYDVRATRTVINEKDNVINEVKMAHAHNFASADGESTRR
jgi:hypothetical protein